MEHILVQRLHWKCTPMFLKLGWDIARLRCCGKIPLQRSLYTRNTNMLTGKQIKTPGTKIRGAATSSRGNRKTAWAGVLAITGVCGIVFYLFDRMDQKRKIGKIKQNVESTGKVEIGGKPWSLTDHNGVDRTDQDFLGQWVLFYFGFTHCPDVCPEELDKIAKVVEAFNRRIDIPNIQPLFVTIDPDRDTPKVIKKYCKEFSPSLLGLTGTPEQLENIRKTYRIFFSTGPVDENGDYLIDHAIISYLVRPDGSFADYYPKRVDEKKMIQQIEIQIKKFETEQRK